MNNLNSLAKDSRINESANVKDTHSIIINAPVEEVWKLLVNISDWSRWNPEISNIKIAEEVKEGTVFKWKIGGTSTSSEVQKLDDRETLAFTGKSMWVKNIYLWQLEADDNQTIASLGASMQGFLAILVDNHQQVYSNIRNWLNCLKEEAEKNGQG